MSPGETEAVGFEASSGENQECCSVTRIGKTLEIEATIYRYYSELDGRFVVDSRRNVDAAQRKPSSPYHVIRSLLNIIPQDTIFTV